MPIMVMEEAHMAISARDVQKVIRTYGRRLRQNPKGLRSSDQRDREGADSVDLAAQPRSEPVVEGSAAEIIDDMHREDSPSELEGYTSTRLSEE
jgi:hypothetical protein